MTSDASSEDHVSYQGHLLIAMPGLSGEETARELRTMGVETPIVALTANAFEDDRHACLAAGMNDFLVKPLSPDALRAMLIRWAGRTWTDPAQHFKVG